MTQIPTEQAIEWQSYLEKHPEYAQAIGMISIENANLEMALADLLAAVLQIRNEVGRAIYFTPRANILRVEILDATAQSRLRPKREDDKFYENEPRKAKVLEKISNIVGRAKSVIGRRHEVIHDAWGIDDTTGAVLRAKLQKQDEGKLEDISALKNLVRDIRKAITLAKNLTAEMREHPPTLIDMRTERS